MTHRHDGGAPGAFDEAHRALRDLVLAATVRIHRSGVGYAPDEPGTFLGSGFFIAPNWVLTCAHVVHGGEGGDVAVIHQSGPDQAASAVAGEVVATLPDRTGQLPSGSWPAPDLALVRLREPVGHDCVYVSERPTAYVGEGKLLYAGWTAVGGQLQILDGPIEVQGTLGGWTTGVQMRLGHNDLPYGVSGGPVVDPQRGEVIGVLKSRTDHGQGGTSTGVERLRTLPAPRGAVNTEHDDVYQAVFHAHDRYHRHRQLPSGSRGATWADAQKRIGARPGRTLDPDERTELLGRLAELPPPAGTRALLDILESLPGLDLPQHLPAPRGWRDGLGLLYENARDDGVLKLVLDYAMRVMCADRDSTPSTQSAERALWEWVRQTAAGLDSGYRSSLARQREEWAGRRARPPGHRPDGPGTAPDGTDGAPPRPGTRGPALPVPAERHDRSAPPGALAPARVAPGLTVLLEVLRRGWEPDRCDWSVSVARPDGDVLRLHEAERTPWDRLAAETAGPLAEAFRRCDAPDRPAPLQAALPHLLLGLPVDAWQLHPGEPPLGVQRPVVVRCSDRDQLPDDGAWGTDEADDHHERQDRWRRLHTHDARAEILDCDDGVRQPVPPVSDLRALAHRTVPVLCRYGEHRYEDDAAALVRIVHAGFGVALWRRRSGRSETVCGEFHRGARQAIDDGVGAELLPEVVHAMRVKLRAGRTEAYWADGIALYYDDPHRPLPGAGDLLEAP
ncbi:VMAP-C domain-containing protein [Streptomyces galbus]|uniref:Trypsin-like peptidase domain-containing protein n=1 Tax=Streptomyces galbus TaxID=33898 RepID=A0ABX1IR21_STRGB|nr:trypsin-like peptidase domain-containing protein [Streptomyces galbus]NKQ27780.1 trypsin-like peptidase domain-containing protein [Streptomyces galbus]